VAKALLEYETLGGEEIKSLLEGKGINREKPTAPKIKKSSFPTIKLAEDGLEGSTV